MDVLQHFGQHWGDLLTGAAVWTVIARIAVKAVNTFPHPTNRYGVWFLGIVAFAVRQFALANHDKLNQEKPAQHREP
jgi:hypothetical protein